MDVKLPGLRMWYEVDGAGRASPSTGPTGAATAAPPTSRARARFDT